METGLGSLWFSKSLRISKMPMIPLIWTNYRIKTSSIFETTVKELTDTIYFLFKVYLILLVFTWARPSYSLFDPTVLQQYERHIQTYDLFVPGTALLN